MNIILFQTKQMPCIILVKYYYNNRYVIKLIIIFNSDSFSLSKHGLIVAAETINEKLTYFKELEPMSKASSLISLQVLLFFTYFTLIITYLSNRNYLHQQC